MLNQTMVSCGAVIIAATIGTGIALIISLSQGYLSDWFKQFTWVIPVAGSTFIIILALSVFWLVGIKKNSKHAPEVSPDKTP